MTNARLVELHLGDVVRLKRDHACGGTDWSVVRLGADIGLRCLTCGHRILLPRPQLERRLKLFVSHAHAGDGLDQAAQPPPGSGLPANAGSEAEASG